MKNLLLLSLLALSTTTISLAAAGEEPKVSIDDILAADSITINTTFKGHPLLAATGLELVRIENGSRENPVIDRASKLCERFGYSKRTSSAVQEESNLIVADLDEKGNFYVKNEKTFKHDVQKEFYTITAKQKFLVFKSISCEK